MQIVIDIPEEKYNYVKKQVAEGIDNPLKVYIANGTPIPKGHGKIVDIGKIDEDRIESDNPIIYLTVNGEYIEAVSLDYLNDLPPIIEADEESED